MNLKNNRAPPVSHIKLCASSYRYMSIQTGVTVRKRLSWVLTSVTLTFDLWPWLLAWISLLSLVITPENVMMIQKREQSWKGVTDGRTDGRADGQTERSVLRAAWSQLKYDPTQEHQGHPGRIRRTNCEAVLSIPRSLWRNIIVYNQRLIRLLKLD